MVELRGDKWGNVMTVVEAFHEQAATGSLRPLDEQEIARVLGANPGDGTFQPSVMSTIMNSYWTASTNYDYALAHGAGEQELWDLWRRVENFASFWRLERQDWFDQYGNS
jgi:hypothetical protein